MCFFFFLIKIKNKRIEINKSKKHKIRSKETANLKKKTVKI